MTNGFDTGVVTQSPERRHVRLPAGDLSIAINSTDLPLDELCGFGARRNPRRGFLFVSKVMGRHMPARPSTLRDVSRRLAAKVPADLPGPVVVVAMAEMAIGLGQTVYEELLRRTGRTDLLFCHSTRFRLDAPLALDFHEEHSHATSHLVHTPADPFDAEMFRSARTLVLIDDEMSTGSTFINLARAFAEVNPAFERVVTIVITDWTGPERAQRLHDSMPVPYQSIALLTGEYVYTPWPDAPAAEMPNVTGNGELKSALLPRNYGRLGLRGVPVVPAATFDAAVYRPGEKVLVLGTGEFAYLPFKLAERIERDGVDVWCQSTTRSPIMVAHDIKCDLTFRDNYDDGIPNFLYNVTPGQYDRVILCYETPERTVQHDLVATLNAQPLFF